MAVNELHRRLAPVHTLKPLHKLGLVAGGYLAALLLACAAVALNGAFSGPPTQASSGMQAFGDLLLFIGVFGLTALLPTGAALFFLSSGRSVGTLLWALGLALAIIVVTVIGLVLI